LAARPRFPGDQLMTYLLLEDFRGGVDRRRPIYASKPGTLWSCSNAHITAGGDIEKRKALVSKGAFGASTFGLFAQLDILYTFGSADPSAVSLPTGVVYQRLQHPNAIAMVGLIDVDLFSGRIYAIAKFSDNAVLHFYDGVLIRGWNDGVVRTGMTTLANLATILAALIDASPNYAAVAAGQVITVTASTAGTPFTASPFAASGGLVNDQTFVDANVTPNVVAVAGVASACGFEVTGGTGAGTITSIIINGVEVLVNTVTWTTSNSNTAALIATEINTHTGATGWGATSVGQRLTITKNAVGSANNNFTVQATWTGTFFINGVAAATAKVDTTAGGANSVAAVAKVDTLTIGGTFDAGDRFGVTMVNGTVSPVTEYFGNVAQPFGTASCVKTHKRKVYAGAASLLEFSAVNAATLWNQDVDPGAGFINVSTHVGGSEAVNALETYQGRLAVFSRRAIQLWTMQNDDTLNDLQQTMENTGTRSRHGTLEYGGNDVFYLDDTGIRSLRARDASNNAFVYGVAAAINKLVREWMRESVTEDDIVRAVAAVEPEDGRFWMAIGTRIFVYSYFQETGVSAWTWYDVPFKITHAARTTNRLYVRGDDNNLYIYGGDSGNEYDASVVNVMLPFTSAKKPGTFKNLGGMDIAAASTWDSVWHVDPDDLDQVVQMGSDTGVTFATPNWAGVGHATHVAPEFTQSLPEYASISQVALHYEEAEEG